ncbi:MAG TPA: histone deacetylase [Actinomycetota bacterium]|nr:histone deacetylase [Actinomycetota bacterium]
MHKLKIFADPTSAAHNGGAGHPERPARLTACLEAIDAVGIEVTTGSGPASGEQLARVHEASYLGRLERFCARGGGSIDADTYACPESFGIAARASGAVCLAVAEALLGRQRSFCLPRPPGHHATADAAMGFCLLNHAAVGAAEALNLGARKVAIVDYDVHHGNGTQDIFWADPRVLYVSIHQYPWYPGTGALEDTGGGEGEGTTVNVPLPSGTSEDVYFAAMQRIVVPALGRFSPDLIIVSAGFDAHEADPLAEMLLTAESFEVMTSMLVLASNELCSGRLVLTLEGGYDLPALAESAMAALTALSGEGGGARAYLEDAPPRSLEALRRAIDFHEGAATR